MVSDQRLCLEVLAVCTAILYLKFKASTLQLGTSRKRAPEDASVNQKIGAPAQPEIKKESENGFSSEDRANRIVSNDMENIYIGLILNWASYIAGGNYLFTIIIISLFTICRILHTIFYLKSIQPWRSIIWAIGALCNICAMINMLLGAFDENFKLNN